MAQGPPGRRARDRRAAPRRARRRRARTTRSRCGRANNSVKSRACVRISRRARRPRGAAASTPIARAGAPRQASAQSANGIVEMQDAHALAPDLHHVEIAIGVERIARVVAGDHRLDARRFQFVQRGDAAPARRAAGVPILQVHIAHRQRHDGEPGARDLLDHPLARSSSSWRASEQQWPTRILPAKRCCRRRVGDDAERARGGIGGFVDMEIEVPALALGEREQSVERFAASAGSCR